jgi:uncharacterized protein YaeQ
MVRLLAFALNAHDALSFAEGLATNDEPDLWRRDLTGRIEQWIDVGLPDERLVRKACGRADRVLVVSYGRAARAWWTRSEPLLGSLANLTVLHLPDDAAAAMARLAQRNMRLTCTVQEGQAWLGDGRADPVGVEPQVWKAAAGTPETRAALAEASKGALRRPGRSAAFDGVP